ncbi:MAG: isoprenyl transferase [Clostridia bacterium]|nr:isoprenyl transferase [Clostridia bacterium]
MLHVKIDSTRIPAHVAIVMDGNGRWAKKRGLPRIKGHNEGMLALKEIVKHSSVLGISYLTVYAFSTENWKRPQDEVSGIFKLLVLYVQKEIKELNDNNVKVNILGDWSILPQNVQNSIISAIETTKNNTGLQFNIALNYGGRAEIVRAIKSIAKLVCEGSLNLEDIDEECVEAHLYTEGMPDPDMIIRTGGELRLSNYLIWQAAYSEIVISEVFWPDFSPKEYEKAIVEFQSRERRFGGLK